MGISSVSQAVCFSYIFVRYDHYDHVHCRFLKHKMLTLELFYATHCRAAATGILREQFSVFTVRHNFGCIEAFWKASVQPACTACLSTMFLGEFTFPKSL